MAKGVMIPVASAGDPEGTTAKGESPGWGRSGLYANWEVLQLQIADAYLNSLVVSNPLCLGKIFTKSALIKI